MYHGPALPTLFEKSWKNVASFLSFIMMAGLFLYFASHMMDYISSNVDGRDQGTLTTSLPVFLNRGTGLGWHQFLELFFAGSGGVVTVYIGLFPLVFLLYGLIKARGVGAISIWVITGFLALFSMGDMTPFAAGVYKIFPPIRYFRYIGYVKGMLQVFLLLGAGFGLDCFLKEMSDTRFQARTKISPVRRLDQKRRLRVVRTNGASWIRFSRLLFPGCVVIVSALMFVLMYVNRHGQFIPMPWTNYYWFTLGLLSAASVLVAFVAPRNVKIAGVLVTLCFAIDILTFQGLVHQTWRYRRNWVRAEATHVRPLVFQPTRMAVDGKNFQENPRLDSIHPRIRAAWMTVNAGLPFAMQISAFNFIQFDPVKDTYLTFYRSQHVNDLLVKKGSFRQWYDEAHTQMYQIDLSNPWLNRAIAFESPKLKMALAKDVWFANDGAEAERLVRSFDASDLDMVLEGVAEENASRKPEGSPLEFQFGGTVTEYSSNRLVAKVQIGEPAWLYYADSYHPGWHATVDGETVPVAKANLAFKAVHIPAGEHEVQFVYRDGLRHVASVSIAILGLGFAMVLSGWIVRHCFQNREHSAALPFPPERG